MKQRKSKKIRTREVMAMFLGDMRIREQVVPRRYQLGFVQPMMFRVGISPSLIDFLRSSWAEIDSGWMMSDLRNKFDLTEFVLGGERLGFVEARMTGREPMAADLETFGVNLCEVAQRGPGRNHEGLNAVLATIKVITMVAPDCPIEEGTEQLLSLYQCLAPKMNGYALAAATSLPVRRWIEAHFNEELEQRISRVLIESSEVLSRNQGNLDRYQFQVRKNPGHGFVVDIPGNACGLYVPGYKYFHKDEGWELETHNVDSSLQQMLFLIALGMLCEEIGRTREGT